MLNLRVPSAEPVLQYPVETRPKAVSAWLDHLPFASPADTAQQLVMALYALNRHPLGEDERYALLALYRPVVERAAASLETLLAESGVPPHAQQRQIGVLLRELLIEHSIGYKHVLLALDNRRFRRGPAKRAAEVMARLLATLRDIQIASYLAYSPPPDGLWLEMHQLYQEALATGLADSAVSNALPASLLYRQVLLLALADPPHMSRAEITHTRLYLDKFASLAVLTTVTSNARHSCFAIPTDSDRGPGQGVVGLKEGSVWLDTEAVCRHLYDTTIRLRTGDSPQGMESELSQTLSKRLLKLWRNGAQRAFKRYPASSDTVRLVAGVSAIHHLLEGAPQAVGFDPEADDTLPIHGVEPLVAAPMVVNVSHWSISNDSAAGLALRGIPDAPLNLKVGDALALQTDNEAVWSLAVIRWMKMLDAQQVELGIERLSPQIQPVWVRPLRGHRKANPEPALFVPGLPALKQPDRLLLPRHVYHAGMDAEIWHTARQYMLSFGRRHLHTSSFDLIDFIHF
jgi:hypothetical protein